MSKTRPAEYGDVLWQRKGPRGSVASVVVGDVPTVRAGEVREAAYVELEARLTLPKRADYYELDLAWRDEGTEALGQPLAKGWGDWDQTRSIRRRVTGPLPPVVQDLVREISEAQDTAEAVAERHYAQAARHKASIQAILATWPVQEQEGDR